MIVLLRQPNIHDFKHKKRKIFAVYEFISIVEKDKTLWHVWDYKSLRVEKVLNQIAIKIKRPLTLTEQQTLIFGEPVQF